MRSEKMNVPAQHQPTIQYVAFDKKTGRILHTYSKFNAEHNKYVEVPTEKLRQSLAKDANILDGLTDHDAANLEILKAEPEQAGAVGSTRLMVDPQSKTLVQKPKLLLKSDKPELTGDGKDSATITILAVNAEGKAERNVKSKIKVTTTRGKLSERGGVVELAKGGAKITLTSVNETVGRVKISATSLDGNCAAGHLIVQFV
jgi:hypothetical protein